MEKCKECEKKDTIIQLFYEKLVEKNRSAVFFEDLIRYAEEKKDHGLIEKLLIEKQNLAVERKRLHQNYGALAL